MAKKKDHPDDMLGNEFFVVEIDGIASAVFKTASGLNTHIEVLEYQEGGENQTTHKLLGQTRWSNIVLRSGMTDNMDLYNWIKDASAGNIKRRNGAIILTKRGDQPKPIVRWDFKNGWPCRWEGPQLDSLENALALETLEIAHDGFEMKKA